MSHPLLLSIRLHAVTFQVEHSASCLCHEGIPTLCHAGRLTLVKDTTLNERSCNELCHFKVDQERHVAYEIMHQEGPTQNTSIALR